jgi:hypothetical protein
MQAEEFSILGWVAQNGPQKWEELARLIPGRSARQCRERWYDHLDPDMKHIEWTAAEDKIISDVVLRSGRKWSRIAPLLPGRSETAVKNRWDVIQRTKSPISMEDPEQPAVEQTKPLTRVERNRKLFLAMLEENEG